MNYQYDNFIKRWKAGKESGNVGKKVQLSAHVRRYINEKYFNECCLCGWGEPHPVDGKVPCEVDHIDGDAAHTTEDNLRLLCPNCHSLTPNYKARNTGKSTRNYK